MISKKIKALREHNNYTQDDLALACNVTRSAISNWENERREPSHDMVRTIACIFGVTIEELLNDNISIEEILNGPEPSISNDTNIDSDQIVIGNKRFSSVVQKINVVLTLIVTICLLVILVPAIKKNEYYDSSKVFSNIDTATLQLKSMSEIYEYEMIRKEENIDLYNRDFFSVSVNTDSMFANENIYYYTLHTKITIILNGRIKLNKVFLIDNNENCLEFNDYYNLDIRNFSVYLFMFYIEDNTPYLGAFLQE